MSRKFAGCALLLVLAVTALSYWVSSRAKEERIDEAGSVGEVEVEAEEVSYGENEVLLNILSPRYFDPAAFDSTNWHTFTSSDGGLEFLYPARLGWAQSYGKAPRTDINPPSLPDAGVPYSIRFKGSYLPSNIYEELEKNKLEYEDEMTGYIIVFPSEDILPWSHDHFGDIVKVGDTMFSVHEELNSDQTRTKTFVSELSDGRVLHAQFTLSSQSLQDDNYQWKLADAIMEEIMASVSVSGTTIEKSSYDVLEGGLTKYTNHSLGLSFVYPSKYELSEYRSSESGDPYIEGESLNIGLSDEHLGNFFNVQATSDDWWSDKYSEGCCYVYTAEPIDLSLGIGALERVVEEELMEIYIPEKVNIADTTYFRSMFAGAYVQTWVESMYLTPTKHVLYNNILFESDRLIYVDGTPETVQSNIFNVHGNTRDWSQYSEFDQEKISAFEEIMATVKFE